MKQLLIKQLHCTCLSGDIDSIDFKQVRQDIPRRMAFVQRVRRKPYRRDVKRGRSENVALLFPYKMYRKVATPTWRRRVGEVRARKLGAILSIPVTIGQMTTETSPSRLL